MILQLEDAEYDHAKYIVIYKYTSKKGHMFWMVPVQSIFDLRQWDASARADVKYFPHHITHLECKLARIHQVTLIQNKCLDLNIYPISLVKSTVN